MANTITLYKNSSILEEKNFVVESIDDYLARFTGDAKKVFNVIQYIKNGLNAEAKVELSQDELDRSQTNTYDYAVIQNDSGEKYYYYIRERKWTSKNCIRLVLRLDVLNTYEGQYTLTKKTGILREHANRWENKTPIPQNASNTIYLQSKVDNVSEDFGDVVKQLKSSNTIYENPDEPNNKWFLVYRTPDIPTANSPVDVFLVPNFDYSIGTVGSNEVTLNKDYFSPGYTYYFTNKDNLGTDVSITADGQTKRLDSGFLTTGRHIAFAIGRETTGAQNLFVVGIQYGADNTNSASINTTTGSFYITGLSSVTITNGMYLRRNNGEVNSIDVDFAKIQNEYSKILIGGSAGSPIYSQKIDDINRTDTRILKIIECPYCPLNLNFEYDKYTIDVPSRMIKINYQAELFNAVKIVELANYVELNKEITYENPYYTLRTLKDSKLLHSSTTDIKFVYDSYSKYFALENIGINRLPSYDEPYDFNVDIEYKQANTITSSLAFKLVPLGFNEKGESDYYEYIVSTRNNEIPLYHNEYLNYMRTDYNYARKSQQLSMVNNIFNTATAGIGGAIAGGMSGGVGGAIAGAITGSAKGIQTTITQAIQSNNAIEQTQLNKRMAATGVSGSDDLNLFNYYSENRLIVKVYEPKEYLLNKIDDLYYYCGYKRSYQGIPNTHSRLWFNYLQCNPVFEDNAQTAKMGNECKEELVRKFNEGVTFMHKVNAPSIAVPLWNLPQTLENWEIELMN